MYIYLIIPIIFIIDLYIFIISPYITQRRNKLEEEKKLSSRHEEVIGNITITIEEYPRKTLISIKGEGSLELDIPYIYIKDNIFIDKLILNNVKKIYNFNIKANSIEINNSKYYSKDDAIFVNNQLLFIYKDKNFNELVEYAKNYSISKNAIRYFSNAPYVQFNKNEYEFRVSKPYNTQDEEVFLIVPAKIDLFLVNSLSINIKSINNLYISKNIDTIILEKEVLYDNIINDSNHFKIRNNSIVSKVTKKYVNFEGKVFRQKNETNRQELTYIGKYHFKKFQGIAKID